MSYIVPLIGYRTPPLSDNDRMHWAKKAKAAQEIQSRVLMSARVLKLPRGLQQAHITLFYCPAAERAQRDDSNLTATLKPAVDALVRYGLVRDDDHRIVTTGCRIKPVEKMPPLHWYGSGMRQPARLWLEVEDLSPVVSGDRPTNPPSAA